VLFGELQKATKAELETAAVECLQQYKVAGGLDKPAHLLEAQLYMRELDRRSDSWISLRDLILEIVVIALIGGEIWLGWKAGRDEDKLMSNQTAVIERLRDSADLTARSQAATAGTLESLQATSKSMNAALQGQLALFYDVSLNVFWDATLKRLRLSNNGRTNVSFVGGKFANKLPILIPDQIITPNAVYTEQVPDIEEAMTVLPKNSSRSFPLVLYLKNAKQEEFVVEQNIDLSWEGDKVVLRTQTSSIRPEKWSKLNIKRP
jgi:hypothetical protein